MYKKTDNEKTFRESSSFFIFFYAHFLISTKNNRWSRLQHYRFSPYPLFNTNFFFGRLYFPFFLATKQNNNYKAGFCFALHRKVRIWCAKSTRKRNGSIVYFTNFIVFQFHFYSPPLNSIFQFYLSSIKSQRVVN